MSLSDTVFVAVELVLCGAAVLIAFWALSLRRALVDRPYRSRAFWTAVGALTLDSFFAAGYVDGIFGNNPTTYTALIAEAFVWGFVFVGLFGWIASNATVAVEADYFNRDVLLWKRGGRVVAPVMVFTAYVLFNLPPWWFPQAGQSSLGPVVTTIGNGLVTVAVVYAVVVISVTYLRILDKRIKTYTLWVALSIATAFVSVISSPPVSVIAVVAFLYFMYRSVGTLAIRTKTLNAT